MGRRRGLLQENLHTGGPAKAEGARECRWEGGGARVFIGGGEGGAVLLLPALLEWHGGSRARNQPIRTSFLENNTIKNQGTNLM